MKRSRSFHRWQMWLCCAVPLLAICCGSGRAAAAEYPDRLVWVFGWNLSREGDVAAISEVLETAAANGINGAVFSLGLDTLCKKSPEYFQRLEAVQAVCRRKQLEFIPAVFSVGYGGGILSHNRQLAEGLPVRDAPFLATHRRPLAPREDSSPTPAALLGEARLIPDPDVRLVNGGFEDFTGDRLSGFRLQDQPGEVSHIDRRVRRGGQAAVRLENFTRPHGHGRLMQEVRVRPHRCYRISLWVKTEELQPPQAFRIQVLAGERSLAPRSFGLQPTGDWRKLTMVFNSLDLETVRLYAGLWGGRSGRIWLDDWQLEEVGPLNVLNRPGTPVEVRSQDGAITYTAGRDYAPLEDPGYSPYRVDREAPALQLLPGSRIRDGQQLRVSWYHSQVINDSQVTVCMAEPEAYEIFEHEAALLAERLRPRRVFLNMDEVRMGGTCAACAGRDMGQLLGECITRQVEALRRHLPGVQVYVWSDMLDPHHNARGDYYLVRGDFTGSWNHVPRDLTIAVWGGAPREKSLSFFAERDFATLIACYYDADDLDEVRAWLRLAGQTRGVRGLMYTPWQKRYQLLPEFGRLLQE